MTRPLARSSLPATAAVRPVHSLLFTHTHTRTHTRTLSLSHTHTHAHMHTHAHTRTHTRTLLSSLQRVPICSASDHPRAAGYLDNTTWARGEAWGVYGFTMMYRYTRKVRGPRRAVPATGHVYDMFMTPLCQQHASHTLASRAYGPSHACGVNQPQDHAYTRLYAYEWVWFPTPRNAAPATGSVPSARPAGGFNCRRAV